MQRLLQPFALADVHHGTHHPDRFAYVVLDGHPPVDDGRPLPIRPFETIFFMPGLIPGFEVSGQTVSYPLIIFWMDVVHPPLFGIFDPPGGMAEQFDQFFIPDGYIIGQIPVPHRHLGRMDDHAVEQFAFRQGGLPLFSFGDVHHRSEQPEGLAIFTPGHLALGRKKAHRPVRPQVAILHTILVARFGKRSRHSFLDHGSVIRMNQGEEAFEIGFEFAPTQPEQTKHLVGPEEFAGDGIPVPASQMGNFLGLRQTPLAFQECRLGPFPICDIQSDSPGGPAGDGKAVGTVGPGDGSDFSIFGGQVPFPAMVIVAAPSPLLLHPLAVIGIRIEHLHGPGVADDLHAAVAGDPFALPVPGDNVADLVEGIHHNGHVFNDGAQTLLAVLKGLLVPLPLADIPEIPSPTGRFSLPEHREGVALEDPTVLEPQGIEALPRGLVEFLDLGKECCGIFQLFQGILEKSFVFPCFQEGLRDAPDIGESAVELGDFPLLVHHQDSIVGRFHGGPQQRFVVAKCLLSFLLLHLGPKSIHDLNAGGKDGLQKGDDLLIVTPGPIGQTEGSDDLLSPPQRHAQKGIQGRIPLGKSAALGMVGRVVGDHRCAVDNRCADKIFEIVELHPRWGVFLVKTSRLVVPCDVGYGQGAHERGSILLPVQGGNIAVSTLSDLQDFLEKRVEKSIGIRIPDE